MKTVNLSFCSTYKNDAALQITKTAYNGDVLMLSSSAYNVTTFRKVLIQEGTSCRDVLIRAKKKKKKKKGEVKNELHLELLLLCACLLFQLFLASSLLAFLSTVILTTS